MADWPMVRIWRLAVSLEVSYICGLMVSQPADDGFDEVLRRMVPAVALLIFATSGAIASVVGRQLPRLLVTVVFVVAVVLVWYGIYERIGSTELLGVLALLIGVSFMEWRSHAVRPRPAEA